MDETKHSTPLSANDSRSSTSERLSGVSGLTSPSPAETFRHSFNSALEKRRSERRRDWIGKLEAFEAKMTDSNRWVSTTLPAVTPSRGWPWKRVTLRRMNELRMTFHELAQMCGIPSSKLSLLMDYEPLWRQVETPLCLALRMSSSEFRESIGRETEREESLRRDALAERAERRAVFQARRDVRAHGSHRPQAPDHRPGGHG